MARITIKQKSALTCATIAMMACLSMGFVATAHAAEGDGESAANGAQEAPLQAQAATSQPEGVAVSVEPTEGDFALNVQIEGEAPENGQQGGDNQQGGSQEGNQQGGSQEGNQQGGDNQQGNGQQGENQQGGNADNGNAGDGNADDNKSGDAADEGNQQGNGQQEGDNKESDNKEGDNKKDDDKKGDNKEGGKQKDEQPEVEAAHVTMFRLYNRNTGEHLFTADKNERNSIVPLGWTYEGLAWDAPETGDPVYRVFNPYTGDHHYTTDANERDALVDLGWNDEQIGWYSDGADAAPLYRLYNPNAVTGAHHYTTDIEERDALVRLGWSDEGIGWYGKIPDGSYVDDMEPITGIITTLPDGTEYAYYPVYRLYNPAINDHLYTTNAGERNSAASWIWHYEGQSWMAASVGSPVYRLSNPYTGTHMFTMSADEYNLLADGGWQQEGVAFYSPLEDDAERVPVYRLSDPDTGDHFFTASETERNGLLAGGWADEGVAWYGHVVPEGYPDDLPTWTPRISGDATFDMQLESILYYYNTLRSAYDYVVGFSYISGDRFWSGPFYLDDGTTKAYAQEMIADGGGNCYRFASLFSWLARGLGYSANAVSGYVPSASGGSAPHGWVEIYIDGGTYICDPDLEHELGGDWYMYTYANAPTSYGSW